MTTSNGAQADRCAAAAATGQLRPQPHPWQQLLGGLQRNCQQLAANLSRVQQQACAQLQARRPVRQAQSIALPVASLSQAAAPAGWSGGSGSGAAGSAAGSSVVTREEVGRATWTFLHTLAAQYPEKPTRQQRRDARNLIDILTRMYPCGECARHFRELVAASPPSVASRRDFSLWMCEAHNTVNRRLGKPTFNCALVEARWAGMGCEDEAGGQDACSLEVGRRW